MDLDGDNISDYAASAPSAAAGAVVDAGAVRAYRGAEVSEIPAWTFNGLAADERQGESPGTTVLNGDGVGGLEVVLDLEAHAATPVASVGGRF